MQKLAAKDGVEVFSPVSHTLFNPVETIQKALLYSILLFALYLSDHV
jgi:hypothetical protein